MIAKNATDHGRAKAETTITAFLANEMTAAETFKLRCVHMQWGKDSTGTSREMYVYQIFCNDKLCKVFEPTTKTFPTVFLDGIQSIVPRIKPADRQTPCIAGKA